MLQLGLLNRALNLHEHTPLTTTLKHIAELVTFRNKHENCNNVIFTLKNELANIRASFQEEVNVFLGKKLEIARKEAEKLFWVGEEREVRRREGRKYRVYQSLEEFMGQEYELKVRKNIQDSKKYYLVNAVNEYYLPVGLKTGRQEDLREEGMEGGVVGREGIEK